MIEARADLHVHTGRTGGMPVKVTASPFLTVEAAIAEARWRKGLKIICLADAVSHRVESELVEMVAAGALQPLPDGGLMVNCQRSAPNGAGAPLLLVPGAELELLVNERPVHVLVLLPGLDAVRRLSAALEPRVRNPALGLQRVHGMDLVGLRELVVAIGGLFGLAHAFTPHRGLYGSLGCGLEAITGMPAPAAVDFVEMGLSADAAMAAQLGELEAVPLIACSDAHNAAAIGREMTELRLEALSFAELRLALSGLEGRCVTGFYGLDPRLGKYHRTACTACGWVASGLPPELTCPSCEDAGDGGGVVVGVADRVAALAAAAPYRRPAALAPPSYYHHVPLASLPGVGPRTIDRLIAAFGSEFEVLHRAAPEDLIKVAGARLAGVIQKARCGLLGIAAGGGGRYGRVTC